MKHPLFRCTIIELKDSTNSRSQGVNMIKNLLKLTVLLTLFTLAFAQSGLQLGDQVPAFSAPADDGSTWQSNDYLGEKYLVVYFYPAAMTGGCTAQACTYRDSQDEIADADALVIGISGDEVDGLALFREAHNLNFPLLSDPDGKLASMFGVPTREGGTLSRELAGEFHELRRGVTASRWTFVIGKDGKLLYKNEEVNPEQDPEQVLAFIKKHQASS